MLKFILFNVSRYSIKVFRSKDYYSESSWDEYFNSDREVKKAFEEAGITVASQHAESKTYKC